MIMSSHQSSFFPWIGYWAKIAHSNYHVVSRNVEFNPRNYQNRVEINGSLRTLPILKDLIPRPYISDVKYDRNEAKRMIGGLKKELLGKKCKNPDQLDLLLRAALAWNTGRLYDLNQGVLLAGLSMLKIYTQIDRDGFDCGKPTKTQRLVERTGMDKMMTPVVYLAGKGQREYLNENELPEGVSVVYQQMPEGVPSCSILELLHRMEMSEIVQLIAQIGECTGVDRGNFAPQR